MEVYIRAINTNYTEEMPTGWVEIESIEALAHKTDAIVEQISERFFILHCEWGNGEGEDKYQLDIPNR